MRKFYERPEKISKTYGFLYECNHPRYNEGRLYLDDTGKGLVIIQQRYDPVTKHTWWDGVDPDLAFDIYTNDRFGTFLSENADYPDENKLYPTFEVRKVMWALRMCPMKKEPWES